MRLVKGPSHQRTLEIIELRRRGWTYQEIGEKFGVSRQRLKARGVHNLRQMKASHPRFSCQK